MMLCRISSLNFLTAILFGMLALKMPPTTAFIPPVSLMARRHPAATSSATFMGKGFNAARNKQAELAKKMELAKKQNQKEGDTEKEEENPKPTLSKEEEQRVEFADLLALSQLTKSGRAVADGQASISTTAAGGATKKKLKDQKKSNAKKAAARRKSKKKGGESVHLQREGSICACFTAGNSISSTYSM